MFPRHFPIASRGAVLKVIGTSVSDCDNFGTAQVRAHTYALTELAIVDRAARCREDHSHLAATARLPGPQPGRGQDMVSRFVGRHGKRRRTTLKEWRWI